MVREHPSQHPRQTRLASTATDSTWNPFTEEHAATSFTHSSYKLNDQHTNQQHQEERFLTLTPLHLLL